jgi:hypothetical protein
MESRSAVSPIPTGRFYVLFRGGRSAERLSYATFEVCGKQTAGAVWCMRQRLLQVAGVQEVEQLHGRRMVRVAYDGERVTPETLLAALVGCEGDGARIVLVARPATAAEEAATRTQGNIATFPSPHDPKRRS